MRIIFLFIYNAMFIVIITVLYHIVVLHWQILPHSVL